MRVLVVGHLGQLGGDLLTALERAGHQALGVDLPECDITVEGSATAALSQHRPQAVVNCAAWTRVDLAESEVDLARRANALGPRLLATACAKAGVDLCHVSTDFVFDGSARKPIDEEVQPRPLSVYGRTKLEGEVAVREELPGAQVARTAWLYGRRGPNFVLSMLRLARERGEVRVVADQIGSPTWTGHLAPALVRLLELAAPGTYHLTGSGATSWHGFAEAILEEAGLAIPVVPITTDEYPTPAHRPAYSVLANRAWLRLGEPPLPPWREGLRAYLAEIGERPSTRTRSS